MHQHRRAEAPSGHIRRDLHNIAGSLEARHERQLRLVLVVAGQDQQIGEIYPSGAHRHAHMARRQRAAWYVGEFQRCLGGAEAMALQHAIAARAHRPASRIGR